MKEERKEGGKEERKKEAFVPNCSCHQVSTYYGPGIIFCYYYYPHFTDKQTVDQRN